MIYDDVYDRTTSTIPCTEMKNSNIKPARF